MLLRHPRSLDEFRGLFTESDDPLQWPHVAASVSYRRALAELAEVLECEPSEEAVFRRRLEFDPDEYASVLLRASGTDLLLIDDGFPAPTESYDWRRMGDLCGCRALPGESI